MVRKYGDPAGPRLYSLQIRSNAGCQLVCYYELKERSWMTEHLNLTSREFCHDPIPRSTPG